jgi:rod shape-determining protein MreB and related proteins
MPPIWERFAQTFYLRLGERRLRIDSPGAKRGFDEAAAIAIRHAESAQAKIEAIGDAAERMQGQPSVSVLYPFAHPRMVVGDFTVAERLLDQVLRAFLKQQHWSFMRPMVRVILHPLREFEGGLTQVEYRALRDLAHCCGGRKIGIHSGRELTMQEVETYNSWLGPRG